MTSLYICYEPGDRAVFNALFDRLMAAHYHILPQVDAEPGSSVWQQTMKMRVRECDQLVLALTDCAPQSIVVMETLAYARTLGLRVAYYEGGSHPMRDFLEAQGLDPRNLSRVRIDVNWDQGVRGLPASLGHVLTHELQNYPGTSEKSVWLAYVTEHLAHRMPGGRLNKSEFIRRANNYLDPHNQYPPSHTHNLFDYRRGTAFPIVQLLAYIRVFKEWIADYSWEEALEFLRLSRVDEHDIARIKPKLRGLFPSTARVNSALPKPAARFWGRENELDDLHDLLVIQGQKIVVLEGMPGIGKTELAKETAHHLHEHFDLIFWQELRTPTPAGTFMQRFVNFATSSKGYHASEKDFLELLRQHRCLLIFDQFESLLDRSNHYDNYLRTYVDYDLLLHDIAGAQHQSALLITSSYMPTTFVEDIALRYQDSIRRYPLKGMDWEYTRILAQANIDASDSDLIALHNHFNGHPNAIKSAIQNIANGQYATIQDYLARAPREGERVREAVLEVEQASPFALDVLYWLAIEREYLSVERLCGLMGEARSEVDRAIRRLTAAYLVEKHLTEHHSYRVRSDVLDYVTERLIGRIVRAVMHTDIETLRKHGLKLANSKDYIREAQTSLLVEAVAVRLVEKVGQKRSLWLLNEVLQRLRGPEWHGYRGYAAANVLHILTALGVSLNGWDFSQTYLRELDLRTIHLPAVDFTEAEVEGCLFAEDFASVLTLALDPSGRYMVAGTTEGRIHLWDLATGSELWATRGTHIWLESVVFSPDGLRVITGDSHGCLNMWDAADGRFLTGFTAQLERGRLREVALGAHGRLATVGDDGRVCVWQLEPYRIVPLWQHEPFDEGEPEWQRLNAVAFHPDGHLLAVAGEQKNIYLLDAETGELLDVLSGHENYIWALAFSPNGRDLASCGEDNTVRIWNLETGTCCAILHDHTNTPLTLAFNQDGTLLASGGIDKSICLWNVEAGTLYKRMEGHYRWVRVVFFSQIEGTEQLLSAGDDKTIRFWDIERGEVIASRQGTQFGVRLLAASSNGTQLAISRENLTVSLQDITGTTAGFDLEYHFNSWVRAMAFSPNGEQLAVAHENHIIVFDSASGKPIQQFQGYPDQEFIWSLDYTPDNRYLVCGGGDETKYVTLWDTKSWARRDIPDSHARWILQAKSSPDSRLLATAGDEGSIKLWSIETGELLWQEPDIYEHTIWMLAFTPDGYLVSATQEPADPVMIWDVSGERLRPLMRIYTGHTQKLGALAVSSDGQTLVTGGVDGLLRLWDLTTGKLLPNGVIQAHRTPVYTLTALPGSGLIASGGAEHIVKLWDIQTRALVDIMPFPRPYEGLILRGVVGISDAHKMALKSFGALVDNDEGFA